MMINNDLNDSKRFMFRLILFILMHFNNFKSFYHPSKHCWSSFNPNTKLFQEAEQDLSFGKMNTALTETGFMRFLLLKLMKPSWQPRSLSQSSFLTIISIICSAWGCCWRRRVNALCLLVGSSLCERAEQMGQHCSSAHITALFDTEHNNSTQEMHIHASPWIKLSSSYFSLCRAKNMRHRRQANSQTHDRCIRGVTVHTQTHKSREQISHMTQNKRISIIVSTTGFSFLNTKQTEGHLMMNDTILSHSFYVKEMCSAYKSMLSYRTITFTLAWGGFTG